MILDLGKIKESKISFTTKKTVFLYPTEEKKIKNETTNDNLDV